MTCRERLFQSFWIAGFECSCQINSAGRRLDMIAAVEHDRRVEEDYAAIRSVGIRTARDGVRWHLIDRGASYDFSSLEPMAAAAERQGVQVIWDICHYGWPDELDIFSAEFVNRYARFAAALAHFFRERGDAVPFYAPVNEISFFSWGAARDLMYPYAHGRDAELKRQLVHAAQAGCEAIWDVDKRARFVWAEPLIHNVPPLDHPDLVEPARIQRESQFEAYDMLGPRYLDIIGVNYYAANQWEVPGGRKLHWDAGSNDPRWMPLHKLLLEICKRYHRPMFMAETSHYGTGRAAWLCEIAREVRIACDEGVPMEGVCLYPILDRHDWEDPAHWHNSGLFDFEPGFRRVLNTEYAAELRAAQKLLP